MHIATVGGDQLAPEVHNLIDVSAYSADSKVFQGTPLARISVAVTYAAATDKEMAQLERISGRTDGGAAKENESKPLIMRRIPIADLIAGKAVGRLNDQDITSSLGLSSGGGNQGISWPTVGRLVYDLAKARGLGTEFPTEMFLQDIRD